MDVAKVVTSQSTSFELVGFPEWTTLSAYLSPLVHSSWWDDCNSLIFVLLSAWDK